MIISIAGLRIVADLDNYYASWFVNTIVRPTEDGFEMYKPQGYTTIKSDDDSKFKTTLNDEFFHYRELSLLDLRAVSIWCGILLYLVFMKEIFSFLYVINSTEYAKISGFSWW